MSCKKTLSVLQNFNIFLGSFSPFVWFWSRVQLKSDLLGLSSLAKSAVSYEERQKVKIKHESLVAYVFPTATIIDLNKCSKRYTKES